MADDRWRVKQHVMCRVQPDESKVSPPGVWMVLTHGSDSRTSWWLMPDNAEAREWANTSTEVNCGCVQVEGKRLAPARVYSDGAWK
jgi:hypothetical protein